MKEHSKRESDILTIIGTLGEATAARIINEIGVSKQRFYVLVAPLIGLRTKQAGVSRRLT